MGRPCAVPRGLAVYFHNYFNTFKSETFLIIFCVVFTFITIVLLSDRDHSTHGYVYEFPNKDLGYPAVFLSDKPVSCFPQNAITIQIGGRLGNQILEYASIWAMAKLYGLKPFAPENMTDRLKDVFETVRIPTTKQFVRKEVPCWGAKDAVTDADVIGTLERMDQNVYSLDNIVDISKRSNRFIVLQMYHFLVEALVPVAPELRREFQYKPALMTGAQKILAAIAYRMALMKGSMEHGDQQVIYVGIHVRRTDFVAQLRLVYTANTQAGVDYYRRAVQWMRSSLSKDAGREVNVAFVVASDDPDWCQQVLIPSLKKVAARGSDGLGQFDVFWGGQGDITTPEQDLVLLSSCNHTIFAYGTFGMWSALVAGGKTVVYDITASEGNRHIKGYTIAMQFALHMDKWIIL